MTISVDTSDTTFGDVWLSCYVENGADFQSLRPWPDLQFKITLLPKEIPWNKNLKKDICHRCGTGQSSHQVTWPISSTILITEE